MARFQVHCSERDKKAVKYVLSANPVKCHAGKRKKNHSCIHDYASTITK